jgi:hypothetical protein
MFRISGKSPTVKPDKDWVYADARESNMGARHGAEERNARGEKERSNRCGRNFEMRHDLPVRGSPESLGMGGMKRTAQPST